MQEACPQVSARIFLVYMPNWITPPGLAMIQSLAVCAVFPRPLAVVSLILVLIHGNVHTTLEFHGPTMPCGTERPDMVFHE